MADPAPTGILLRLYLAATAGAAPLAERHLKKRLVRGKENPARWREKLGEASLPRPDGPLVWMHAVGLGEVLALRFAGLRILVVEDDAISQAVARGLLEDAGFVVDVVGDGQEAVDRVRTTSYALILMDMKMPVMDGVQATRAIRAIPGQITVPILAMTANAFADDRVRCLAAGMNGHISKPVEPDVLYSSLMQWLLKTSNPARI